MHIITQNRKAVINIDILLGLTVKETMIVARGKEREGIFLGEYETEERAQSVFEQILSELFPPAIIVLQNMEVTHEAEDMLKGNALYVKTPDNTPRVDFIEPRVFYMPEK